MMTPLQIEIGFLLLRERSLHTSEIMVMLSMDRNTTITNLRKMRIDGYTKMYRGRNAHMYWFPTPKMKDELTNIYNIDKLDSDILLKRIEDWFKKFKVLKIEEYNVLKGAKQ